MKFVRLTIWLGGLYTDNDADSDTDSNTDDGQSMITGSGWYTKGAKNDIFDGKKIPCKCKNNCKKVLYAVQIP